MGKIKGSEQNEVTMGKQILPLVVGFLALLCTTVSAQDKQSHEVISAENVPNLTEIALLGQEKPDGQYTHVAFSPDGDFVVYDTTFQMGSAHLEGSVHVWQLEPQSELASFPGSFQGFIDESSFSYCVGNETQGIFDLENQHVVSEFPAGWCGILSPSADIVATGEGYYFYLHLRDALTGEIRARSEISASQRAFTSDGSLLATSSVLREIAIWDVSYLLELQEITIADAISVMPHQGILIGPGGDVAFSPDDRVLVYSSLDGLFVWDIENEEVAAELGDGVLANGIAFSPDGTLLATGTRGTDGVRIWNTTTRQQIAELPPWYVTDISFSPDGTILATGRIDGTVILWGVLSGE